MPISQVDKHFRLLLTEDYFWKIAACLVLNITELRKKCKWNVYRALVSGVLATVRHINLCS